MVTFSIMVEVVPKHIWIFQIRAGVALLRVDQGRELGWVSDEKDRDAEKHPVKIPLFSKEFKSESSRVSYTVCRSSFSGNSRKTSEELGFLANLVQESSTCDIADIMSNFELSKGSSAFCMDKPNNFLALLQKRSWL